MWFRIKLRTTDMSDNARLIREVLASLIEGLERTGAIVKFFLLNEGDPPHVMLVFEGNESKVLDGLRSAGLHLKITADSPEPYDPASERYRFGDDYMLGITLFELGSRLALCRWTGKRPQDMLHTKPMPIIFAMRHAFCNNLGQRDEKLMGVLDPPLASIYRIVTGIRIE